MPGGWRRSWRWSAPRAAGLYAVLSFLWILLSDTAVGLFVPDGWMRQEISIVKGFGFVILSALLVYALARATVRASEASAHAHRESERQFRELLDGVDLLAVIVDADGRIVFCNEGAAKTTGYRRDELIGQSYVDALLTDPVARSRWSTSLHESSIGLGAQRRAEVELETRTGERRTIRWTATVLRNRAGEVVGGAAVGEDVTDRQRFEAEMQQAQKMEALGRLAGSVAHDFNNLLTAISGYADLVLAEIADDDRASDDVREIKRAAERASSLTTQLLAFSRRRPVEAVPVDVASSVAAIEPMLRRLIGEQIALVVEARPGSWIMADPSALEQVVLNLCVNARDAMPDGGTLRIEASQAPPELVAERERFGGPAGPHVQLVVSDTGTGIAPEAQGHLFEPFFTTKPKGKGTGLGLATVYSAVTGAGGQIWAESSPARGTRFVCLLPAIEAPATVPDEPPKAEPRGAANARILVAEDDPAVLALVRTVLQREGYAVTEATSGEEALGSLAGREIDLLVSDLVMPGIGGRELVSRVRSERNRLPVLFISGYDEDADLLQNGRKSLDAPLLQKPFSAADLLGAVRDALQPAAAGPGSGSGSEQFGAGR